MGEVIATILLILGIGYVVYLAGYDVGNSDGRKGVNKHKVMKKWPRE